MRSRARGLTLIEVVAALAILGMLLVGIVVAKSRHTGQLMRAQAQTEAVRAADELIAGWWTSAQGVPIGEHGELPPIAPGEAALRWQTRLVDNPEITALGARVVRVEVYDTPAGAARTADEDKPLVEVDLVVRDPEVERREKQEAEEQAEAERGPRERGGRR